MGLFVLRDIISDSVLLGHISSLTCNSHVNYVTILYFQILLCKYQAMPNSYL